MPTASYIRNNDYNLVKDIRPFNMPYEATMNEIATKTNYWRVNADRMKSEYERAVGLDPQFTQNREYLKGFMQEANKNLGKITKSDLSIGDNSQQATKVFEPLYDISNPFNKRLLADSQVNKFYQNQQQLANNYRTKDGGKEWNQNNEFYFRDAQQKYLDDAKAGNLESIDGHFQNRKSFIPYYDFKKELMDLQEACKGQSFQNKGVMRGNELYFSESSKKGCTPTELALAFETGLSDRARQQMQIDGYVHFKGNEDELVRQFTDKIVGNTQKQYDEIDATIKGIKDGGVAKDEVERLAFYEKQLGILKPKLDAAKQEYDDMVKGNPLAYVNKNYDKLAGQVYFNDLTGRLATAFRTDETKELISTNPAGMLRLRLETDRTDMFIQNKFNRENEYLQHLYRKDENIQKGEIDKELARLKGELSETTTNPMGIPQTVDPITGKNVSIAEVTESNFIETTLKPAAAKAQASYNVVNDLVRKAAGNTNSNAAYTDQAISNYVTELQNKKIKGDIISQEGENILQAFERYKNDKDDLAFANDQLSAAEAIVKQSNPSLFDNSDLSTKPITDYKLELTDGTKLQSVPISEKDMYDILNGKNIKGFTSQTVQSSYYSASPTTGISSGTPVTELALFYNGKKVDTSAYKIIGDLMRKVRSNNINKLTEIDKLKTDFFTNQNYINSQMTTFNKMDFGKSGVFENEYGEKIKSFFNQAGGSMTGGLNDKNGYIIVGRDKFGSGAYVRPLDEDGQPRNLNRSLYAGLRKTDKGSRITQDENTQSYYIPDMFPRYAGLPNNQVLDKYNKVQQHIRNIEESLKTNPAYVKAVTMDTRELPVGGTTRYIGPVDGREYIISIYKEQGRRNQYVATYIVPGTGEERKFKEASLDALLPQLR